MAHQKRHAIIRNLLLIIMMTSILEVESLAAHTSCPDSAQKSWKRFRHAALHSDIPAITRKTQFPFVIKGELDTSEMRKVGQEEFKKEFFTLLSADPGLNPVPTTMKALINNLHELPPSSCNADGDAFRVGSWLFELKREDWWFVQAYKND